MMDRQHLIVTRRWYDAPNVVCVELRASEMRVLPAFEAGAHITLYLPNGLARQYSLANDPADRERYLLGIQNEPDSRGGSRWIHQYLKEDTIIETSQPKNHFQLGEGAERYLFIAGGIGITPLLAMISTVRRQNRPFHLYYCTRTADNVAFRDRLSQPGVAERVTFVHDGGDPSKGLNLETLLTGHETGTHLYCCGPPGLMSAVKSAGKLWPPGTLHFEWFTASHPIGENAARDKGFTVIIASTGQEIAVSPEESLLEVLTEHGFEIESICGEGVCGSCLVDVLEGEIDHRDFVLEEREREANNCMTACCSRAQSGRLVLDL
ncbi:PDR/VanB family oxidoreductase [Limibacillus sp. MBR-115]|jgi:vanillate O-demethylase ferredoxin subunit|uniref:PDR/VanB family oxidoreductase n=1 Tax=Limibacillus sp. MBR-115 TaxID=3156465 RepID=UPI0033932D7D